MCATKIVTSISLARTSLVALVAATWLISGVTTQRKSLDQIHAPTENANICLRELPAFREQAYRPGESRQYGSAGRKLLHAEPQSRSLIRFQRRLIGGERA
jgi:hypothetical protein